MKFYNNMLIITVILYSRYKLYILAIYDMMHLKRYIVDKVKYTDLVPLVIDNCL